MTHTAHPFGLRLGILRNWQSRWFDRRVYRTLLQKDTTARERLWKDLKGILVESIEIERSPGIVHFIIKTSQPGLLIGRSGEGAERLKNNIRRYLGTDPATVKLTIEEVRMPEAHASLVAQMMVQDLEKRLPFRRILKTTVEKVLANKEVKGVKVSVKGRLGGAEMSRYEWLRKGRIPLQTLRADIDYAERTAYLPYGTIGVKVWIYKGEVFSGEEKK